MKVSVVISAFNEEAKIEECIKSVKKIADEVILINNSSTDKTSEIAKKLGAKVYDRENNPVMLNTNKNFGFTKAQGEWILSLDADERVTDELEQEILDLKENSEVSGYFIPRKNIIFGKWIEHTGWYPDLQLRLFRKGKGKFEEQHVHEFVKVDGQILTLENALFHLNYENISQFLNKMIKTYTISEADDKIAKGYEYNSLDIIRLPLSEFVSRYFARQGYKDGMHGLVLSLLQAFYHFVVFLRLWEANRYPEEKNMDKLLGQGREMVGHELKHWIYNEKIVNEKNVIRKNLYKIHRKVFK